MRYAPRARRRAGPGRRRRCAPGCARFRRRSPRRRRRRSSRSCRTTAQRSVGARRRSRFRAAPTRSIRTAPPSSARPTRGMPLLYVRESALGGPLAADARLVASIFTDSFTYPSVNVIAKVPGRDPKLARRVRAVQRASGSRRRALSGQRRRDLERRRRQRDDVRGAAGDRPRDVRVAGPPVGAVHLARRRRARADGLALVREASDRAAHVDRRRASTAT